MTAGMCSGMLDQYLFPAFRLQLLDIVPCFFFTSAVAKKTLSVDRVANSPAVQIKIGKSIKKIVRLQQSGGV